MSNKIDKILAEISAGELFDKITILEIKKMFDITNPRSLVKIWLQLGIFSGLRISTLCFNNLL